jgi:glycosyltransferase involved in cell wall biosynthesis
VKICYLANAASIHTVRWVQYFAHRGHEVHLISTKPYGDEMAENVNLHLLRVFRTPPVRIVSSMTNLLPYVVQIGGLLKRVQPDILHAHFISDYAFLGALSGFHPLVLTAWGSDVLIGPKKDKISRFEVKFALRRADLITCDAEHVNAPLVELGANPAKISLINFGVNVQRFSPGPKDEELIKKLEVSDSPVIISLRSLEPIYDIDSLVSAVRLVLEEVPEAKFLIAGKGSQEAKLKELAKSLGVAENVVFAGIIPNHQLPRYLRTADVYVSTSLSDAGIAASTAEAMACGLPVIITDFGDNKKWVEDGTNGFLIPLRNPQVLAARIIQLLRNKEIRHEFGQINRQIIEERNDWQKEMRKMGELYESLMIRSKK